MNYFKPQGPELERPILSLHLMDTGPNAASLERKEGRLALGEIEPLSRGGWVQGGHEEL
jgi:hypothetical protein